MAKGRRQEWQLKKIDQTKKDIKQELDEISAQKGPKERFAAIMRGIRNYETSTEAGDLLILYVYIMSALVHHKNHGGLQPSQIKKMTGRAYSLLQMQDIQPETSQLGFLYGEIHMALSQIHRKSGEHLTAAWEQQLSHHVAKKNPPGGDQYQALAKAIRAMRLGQISRALFEYTNADDPSLPDRQRQAAKLGRVRCLRLMGHFESARTMIAQYLREDEHPDRYYLELMWEDMCVDASVGCNLGRMIQAVQRRGSHYQAVYLVEAHLWALAVPQRHWLKRLPKVATIARNKNLQAKDLGFFLKVMLQLEECYDSSIPLVVRLKSLGQIIHDGNQFIAIDRQLLFYIAAARWLARVHSPTLAAIMLGEYEGYSRQISHGRHRDIFLIADDLMDRPWYQEQTYQTDEPDAADEAIWQSSS
jgi:hypothetical protein